MTCRHPAHLHQGTGLHSRDAQISCNPTCKKNWYYRCVTSVAMFVKPSVKPSWIPESNDSRSPKSPFFTSSTGCGRLWPEEATDFRTEPLRTHLRLNVPMGSSSSYTDSLPTSSCRDRLEGPGYLPGNSPLSARHPSDVSDSVKSVALPRSTSPDDVSTELRDQQYFLRHLSSSISSFNVSSCFISDKSCSISDVCNNKYQRFTKPKKALRVDRLMAWFLGWNSWDESDEKSINSSFISFDQQSALAIKRLEDVGD